MVDESSIHFLISENVIFLCLVILLAFNIGYFIELFHIMWMPASGAQMILGFFLGFIFFITSAEEVRLLEFNTNIFFFLFIPPIIYEAGYAMERANFFKNIGSILIFAFVGTIVSTLVIGGGILYLGHYHDILSISDNIYDPFLFGALISSTDPIATLAILGNKMLNCDPVLYSLVFGESVLNDAISIVLFQLLLSLRQTAFSTSQLGVAAGRFVYVFIGSCVIGALIAIISSFIFRRVNYSHNPAIETVFMFITAYLCYCVGELCSLSGIMALFICGILQAHYAWYNISAVSRIITRHVYHAFALVAESLLYVHLGVCFFFSTQSSLGYVWNFPLVLIAFALSLLGRALNIFPMAFIANLGRDVPITGKMQFVMWFGGLRGAIAFALVSSIDMPEYVTTTMSIIAFTTIFMGGSCHSLLVALDMTSEQKPQDGQLSHPTETQPSSSRENEQISIESDHVTSRQSKDNFRRPSDFHGHLDEDKMYHNTVSGAQYASDSAIDMNNASTSRRDSSSDEHRQPKRGGCCLWLERKWMKLDKEYLQFYLGGRYALQIEDFSAESHHFDDPLQNTPNPYFDDNFPSKPSDDDHDDDDGDESQHGDDVIRQSTLDALQQSGHSSDVNNQHNSSLPTNHPVNNMEILALQPTTEQINDSTIIPTTDEAKDQFA